MYMQRYGCMSSASQCEITVWQQVVVGGDAIDVVIYILYFYIFITEHVVCTKLFLCWRHHPSCGRFLLPCLPYPPPLPLTTHTYPESVSVLFAQLGSCFSAWVHASTTSFSWLAGLDWFQPSLPLPHPSPQICLLHSSSYQQPLFIY